MKDTFELAREAGLTVLLDGKIGREDYHSISGSLSSLVKFAQLYAGYTANCQADARETFEKWWKANSPSSFDHTSALAGYLAHAAETRVCATCKKNHESWQPCSEVSTLAEQPAPNNPAVAAILYALEADEGFEFLSYWNEGEFDICRRNWPDAPEEVYIGADPMHPKTMQMLSEQSEPKPIDIPDDCDVRKILLRVVPGDGDGHEVYAKNVTDVEQLLSEMGERLENFELSKAAKPTRGMKGCTECTSEPECAWHQRCINECLGVAKSVGWTAPLLSQPASIEARAQAEAQNIKRSGQHTGYEWKDTGPLETGD